MGLLQTLEDRLIELLSPILAPIKPLVAIFTKLRENTIGILDAGSNLIRSTESTYEKIRHFTTSPKFNTRVISVPRVSENVGILAAVPGDVIAQFKDLWQQLRTKIKPDAFNIDELENIEDLRKIIKLLGTKLAAVFEKLLGIVAVIVDALVAIRSTIDDLQSIIDSVATAVDNLSDLEGLFLPQSNSRETVTLEDGTKMKLRIGSLHPS